MKIKALISGVTLGISTMANANVPHLDPHALPTLGSLITALNDWESPINATSAQAANAETHANNAESYANSAIQTATSANSVAQQAATTVKTFDSRLITAESDATSAKQIASSANDQAKAAVDTAQTAFDKANSYESRINMAEKNASDAQQTANTAKQTADSIKGTADAAKQAADKASELASSASETANMAKTTADNAKSSADRVDQFDQRITNAENDAKEAKTDAKKAKQNVDEIEQIYSEKINVLSKQIDDLNKIIKDEVADRTIKAQDWQSLDDLIKLAQTSPHIDPKLDADHPVIIKLAPKEYTIDHSIYIPAGIIIDGDNKASLHRYRDARFDDQIILCAPGKLSDLNLINDAAVLTNKNDTISAMVMLSSEDFDTPKYSFTFNNIHYSGGDNSVFVQDNLSSNYTIGSYKVKFDHFVSDTKSSIIWAAQKSRFADNFNPADVYDHWFSSAAKGVYISNSTMCISNLANNGSFFPHHEDKQILSNVNISNSSVTDYSQSCM
ncbi:MULTISPECIES: hypothetical protein [Cysteiniphilum]|uniref:Uncharacterized protein n=1 Tax=Cysteiniphilum litorale TaxID=2056700 RepID=A0A8J3E9N2_9GAMM|nr:MULTISPECIES: hypothetical protein [Cysteiniphilum]GGG05006.1 hypothetical protein GCM10010995_23070 [Cysteiniphilum litorale]